ncbi:Protein CBG27270 [Caenorhabditis briggsae]|uniref:Protein CBG27270 n=1 Tax=Caenorhabditis briggsae TaxID=6238 RepID=B6IFT9_CAEBR|nr:Protein CBG27270 [Caenorhabditis briggsae]CAR98807.1 Protein CBG27270 [Caenorhabditis briggsae]
MSINKTSYSKKKSSNAELDPCPLVLSGEQERTVSRLKARFVREGKYQIKKEWVRLIYLINKRNEKKTIEELGRDVVVRKKVKELYARMKTCDDVKSASQSIDILLRGRNHPLGTLHLVPTKQLEFDFHWFSLKQASKYLHDLIFELKLDPRAVSGDMRIKLIVGGGDYPGSIRQTFRDRYPVLDRGSVLVLTI